MEGDGITPRISVVIPTKNAGLGFKQTLEVIFKQRSSSPLEVVVVDSGSEDETLEICEGYPVKVLRIAPEDFNHGATRNYAISQSRGEFIVLVVQDAVPADEWWMAALIEDLESDPMVAGAYSRHLPQPGADFLVRRNTEYWHAQQKGRVVQRIDKPEVFDKLSVEEKRGLCRFDNVSSAIRRDVWQRYPFPPLNFAEDFAWALQVLKAGYVLIYEPNSMIYHSHDRGLIYNLRRAYIDNKTVLGILGLSPQFVGPRLGLPQLIAIAKEMMASASGSDGLSPRLFWRILSFAIATVAGNRLGASLYVREKEGKVGRTLSFIDGFLSKGI